MWKKDVLQRRVGERLRECVSGKERRCQIMAIPDRLHLPFYSGPSAISIVIPTFLPHGNSEHGNPNYSGRETEIATLSVLIPKRQVMPWHYELLVAATVLNAARRAETM